MQQEATACDAISGAKVLALWYVSSWRNKGALLMPYAEIFEAFPEELRLAVARLVDALKADLDVRRTDFEALRDTVQELAAAQARTEARLDRVATTVMGLLLTVPAHRALTLKSLTSGWVAHLAAASGSMI
jgi:predicted RNA-binding Zn ribbon-like protein